MPREENETADELAREAIDNPENCVEWQGDWTSWCCDIPNADVVDILARAHAG